MGNREDRGMPTADGGRRQVFWSYPSEVSEQLKMPVSELGLRVP